MKRHATGRRVLLAALAACAALSLPGRPGDAGRASAHPALIECEGDACAAVTLAFDEVKGQYRVRNDSPDRWARVTASNLAAAFSACVAPGRDEYLPMKSVVAPYKAVYAEARCGAPAGVG